MDAGAAVRAAAARALHDVAGQGRALDVALSAADQALRDARDRALLRAIVYATLRGYWHYEALLNALLAKPLPPRDQHVQALIAAGLAQLEAGITPAYAAISGTVAATRVLDRPHLAGLVNAVLRRFQREGDALRAALPKDDTVRHDHPAWLLQRLRADWPQDWQSIVAIGNAPAPLVLRVNRRRLSREAYAAKLDAAGIAHRPHDTAPDALVLGDSRDVPSLPGFLDGDVSVQDGAAQLAADLMDLAPGLRVLDACAAPGGKSAHLLEREPSIELLALDLREARCAMVADTFARLKLAGHVRSADATRPAAWWDGRPFDRILVDAPCSGTGVIRRHPDIRLLRRAADLAPLTATQDALLDALWPLLAPGGRLVYATCSVLAQENRERVDAFLARTPSARALPVVPSHFGRESGAGRQRLPGEAGDDGFFYAVLAHRD